MSWLDKVSTMTPRNQRTNGICRCEMLHRPIDSKIEFQTEKNTIIIIIIDCIVCIKCNSEYFSSSFTVDAKYPKKTTTRWNPFHFICSISIVISNIWLDMKWNKFSVKSSINSIFHTIYHVIVVKEIFDIIAP